jgi:hypothetical protein
MHMDVRMPREAWMPGVAASRASLGDGNARYLRCFDEALFEAVTSR